MLVHRFLEDSAARTPDANAILESSRSITYGELDLLSNRIAHVLVGAGVRRGDRVVVAMENCIEHAAAYLGAMKAGAAAVPLPAGPRSDRLAHAIANCTPAACIVDATTAQDEAYSAALADVPALFFVRRPSSAAPADGPARGRDLATELASAPDSRTGVRVIDCDLAAILYTSGSTGEPRGVMLTHRNLVTNARSIISYLMLTARDRVMCVLPLYYVYGLSLLHTHLAVGGSVVLDNRFAFPNVVLNAMQHHEVTGFAGVPSTFVLLLYRSNLEQANLPHLRYVTQAGGHMPQGRILEWLERGPRVPFFVMYGATEAGGRLTYLPPNDLRRKLGSIGRQIPNVEITILKEEGEPVGPGEVGEVVARGSNISCGYWNNPQETSEHFGPHGYRTGDLGYADDEGFLYLVGRRHEMIKVGAHRVGAKEIEDVLYEQQAVQEAAVLGRPHPLLGEVPVAFVALKSELPSAERALHAFCASRLPAHKVPAEIIICADLPKQGQGKIDKTRLRQLAGAS